MPKPIHWWVSGNASVSSGFLCLPSALSTGTRPSSGSLVPGWRALAPVTGVDVALALVRFLVQDYRGG